MRQTEGIALEAMQNEVRFSLSSIHTFCLRHFVISICHEIFPLLDLYSLCLHLLNNVTTFLQVLSVQSVPPRITARLQLNAVTRKYRHKERGKSIVLLFILFYFVMLQLFLLHVLSRRNQSGPMRQRMRMSLLLGQAEGGVRGNIIQYIYYVHAVNDTLVYIHVLVQTIFSHDSGISNQRPQSNKDGLAMTTLTGRNA